MARKGPYFRDFWTPSLGIIVFWFGALVCCLLAGFSLSAGLMLPALLWIAAIFALRMAVEALVVLFQIHDVLVEIRDQGQRADPQDKLKRARELSSSRAPTVPGEARLE